MNPKPGWFERTVQVISLVFQLLMMGVAMYSICILNLVATRLRESAQAPVSPIPQIVGPFIGPSGESVTAEKLPEAEEPVVLPPLPSKEATRNTPPKVPRGR